MSEPYVTIDVTSEGISATVWVNKSNRSIVLDEAWLTWSELVSEDVRAGSWQTFSESVAPYMNGQLELEP